MTNSDRTAAHGDLLLELSFLVNERRSVDEVFASFARRLLEAAAFDYTTLLIGEPGSGHMEVLASYPFELPGATAGMVVLTTSFKYDDLLAAPGGYEYVTRIESSTAASREMAAAGMNRAWVAPLVSGEQVYGIFTVARKDAEPFSEDERGFMLAASRLLTAAVRQEMELRQARRAAARAEAANELALALNSGETIERSFQRLTSLMNTSLAVDYVGLFLDRQGAFMLVDEEPRGIHRGEPPSEEGTRFILERLAVTNFTQTRPQKGASPSDALADAGYRRLGIATLRENERPAGLMIFARNHSLRFNEDEQAFIELIRALLSQSLTNTRRLARSEAEAARSHTLNEVALLLNRGESVESIFSRLLDLISGAIELDYIGLLETTKQRNTFRMIGSKPEIMRPSGALVEFSEAATDAILSPGGTVVQYRIERSLDLLDYNRRMYEEGMRRGVSVAISEGGTGVGVLAMARRRPDRYDAEEVAFIQTLTAMLGQAIANQRRLERVQIGAARSRVLNEAAILLKQDEPADVMFARLLPLLRGALSFDYVALLEADDGAGELAMVAGEPQLTRGPGDRLPISHHLVSQLSAAESPAIQFPLRIVGAGVPGLQELMEAGMQRGVVALLRQADATVGIFTLARFDADLLSDDEMAFILTLGNLLGQAIANRRRLEASERQAARARLLNDLAAKLDAGDPLEALFAHLPGVLPEAISYDHFSLLKVEPEGSAFQVIGVTPAAEIDAGTTIPWPASPELRERLQRRPLIRYNPQEAGEAAHILAAAGYRSAVTVMLRDGDEVIGSIQVARTEAWQFDDEQCKFLETLASLLARAIANQNRLGQARKEAERTRLLNELSVLLHDGQAPEALFSLLTAQLPDLIAFDSLSLLVTEGARLQVVDSLRRQSMKPGTSYALDDFGEAVERLSGRELVWEVDLDDVDGPIAEASRAHGIRRAMIVALRHNQESAGFMFIARTTADPFTAEECAYTEILATMLAQAIANHRKLRESQAEAIRSQVLSELSMLLQEGDAITSRFGRISELLLQAVGFDHISVTVRQPGSEEYIVVRSHELTVDGEPFEFDPAGVGIASQGSRLSQQYRSAESDRKVPRALRQAGFERAATSVILSNDGIEGLLTVGRREDVRFEPREMDFIELVAALIGQATSNHRQAWVKAQEAEEQAIIAEAASAVAREITTLGIASALRQAVGRFIPRPFCNFGYLEGESVIFSAPGRDRIELPIGQGFRRALDHGYELARRTQFGEASFEAQGEVERTGLQSHVITSAQSGGETIGLLIVGSRDPDFEPGNREVRLARLIADIVGPAMANVRAVERQRQEGEDQRLLAEIAAAAARESEPAGLLTAIHRPMRAIVPSPTVIFGYRDGDRTIYPRLDGTYTALPLDPYLRMLDDVVQIHSDELPGDLFAESELWRMGLHAISTTAVLSAGKTVGYLMVGSRAAGYRFAERELRLFRLIAQIVGPAMENARAAERAREDAEEQSILAEAAAALALPATEAAVIGGLAPAVQRFLPGAITNVFILEGDLLSSPEGLGTDRFGPAAGLAMEQGQVVVERPWPPLSDTGRAMLDRAGVVCFANTSLNAGGASTGILFVGLTDDSHSFGERDLRLIRLIADMAGPAIANARESALRRQDAEEQRFLAETAAVAAAATSEGELIRGMARPFSSLVPGSKIDLLFYDGGEMLSAITGMRFPIGAGFQEALETGQSNGPAVAPGTSAASRKRQSELGITFGASTRLSAEGQTLGLFWLGTTRPEPLSDRDLRICRLVADVVGPVLANLRESRRRKEDAEEQRFLAAAAAVAASAATQDELVLRLAEPLKELIPGAKIDLFYLEEGSLTSTITGRPFPIGPNFAQALENGVHLLERHSEAGTEEAAEALARLGVLQALSLRLSSGGQALGLLWIGTTLADRPLTERDTRICRLVADVVGPALANLRESRRRKEDAEDQRFLAEVAAAVARATGQDELIRGLWGPFRSITPSARVSFFYREGDVLRGPGGDFGIGPQVERAFSEGLSTGTIDDEEVIPSSRALMREHGITRWANLLAESEGETLGILHVAIQDREGPFTARELRLYRLAAAIVGPAMAHLRDNARRAREAEDERILARVAAMAAVTSSPDELVQHFTTFVPSPWPSSAMRWATRYATGSVCPMRAPSSGSMNLSSLQPAHPGRHGIPDRQWAPSPIGRINLTHR
ncbi:MAG TPA: GAF domain-containing protein [Tepidiformaceae bacterium]|nr:GAF domain-containing protein [Tepidiformaceae bacterium]